MRTARKRVYGALIWVTAAALSVALSGCGPDRTTPDLVASWAPDGERLVVAPDLISGDGGAGLWLYDAGSGTGKGLLRVQPDQICIHPQWSPVSDDILFALVPKEGDGIIAYSVWKIRPDGEGLEKVIESTIPEGSDGPHPFLVPNAVMWGAFPGTIVFQKAAGSGVTALVFDPYTGGVGEFLPEPAAGYSLQPSPCRRWAAAVLYDGSSRGRVLVSDFGFGNWHTLAWVSVDPEHRGSSAGTIYWSPDSSHFVLPETDPSGDYLRVFDVSTGISERVARAFLTGPVLWAQNNRSFLFAGHAPKDSRAEAGVFRVDLDKRSVRRLIEAEDASLVGWIKGQNRFVFSVEVPAESDAVRRFFTCSADGSGFGLLAGPNDWADASNWIGTTSPGGRRLAMISGTGMLRFWTPGL